MTARADIDAELIERFRAGDTHAFELLMEAHQDRIFGVCLRMLRDREAALDATQETFITVFRKVDSFAGRSAFSTWLYRVAVNTCYDHLRRSKRRHADPLPDHLDPADATANDPFEATLDRPGLADALAQLPPEFRMAVILVDAEDLPIAEAAELLGVPSGTIKSRVFRGRRMLAEILGNQSDPSRHQKDDEHERA